MGLFLATVVTQEVCGRHGAQYVVITAGGHGRIGTTVGDYTIAYTLPETK
jgi:glucose dehydrogenase